MAEMRGKKRRSSRLFMGPDYFTDHLLGRIGQAGVQDLPDQ